MYPTVMGMLSDPFIIRTWHFCLSAATNSKPWCLAYLAAALGIRALNC